MANQKRKPTFMEDIFVGALCVSASRTVAAPLERIKLILQTEDEILKSKRIQKPYKGIMDCGSRLLNEEGVAALWRGNLINVARFFPTTALNFALKDLYKSVFGYDREKDGYTKWFCFNLLAGACAGGTTLTLLYPLDFVRTRLACDVLYCKETSQYQYKNIRNTMVKTFMSDGIGGFYRGFAITLLGQVLYRAFYFGLYDTASVYVAPSDFTSKIALGWIVTLWASMISYPMDTMRRRMMMTVGQPLKYSSSIQCASAIWKEAPHAFWKGAGINLGRGFTGALALAGMDYAKGAIYQ